MVRRARGADETGCSNRQKGETMKRWIGVLAASAVLVGASSPTWATEHEGSDDITTGATKLKVGGTLYALYGYDMSQGPGGTYSGNNNAFDVSRGYLTVEP